MLTLRRRAGEKIILQDPDGGRITISVAQVAGGKVDLAIQAPPCIGIFREEVLPGLEKSLARASDQRPPNLP